MTGGPTTVACGSTTATRRTRGRRKGYRVAAFAAAGATCLAAVGVPVGLVLADSGSGSAVAMPSDHHHPGSTGHGLTGAPAEQQVLSALSATTDAGSFDFTYALSQTAATPPVSTTTSTTTCHEVPVPERTIRDWASRRHRRSRDRRRH